jgi:phosphohistidine phosphatase
MIALHLLRHAHAGDPDRWLGDDAARPLSEKGRRQAERLGRLLAATDEAPDVFITSPKVRAAQTAEIVAAALGGVRVTVDDRLAWGVGLDALSDILGAAADADRPCVVGHDPDFSELLGELIGTQAVPMRKGAIARVDVGSRTLATGRGVLRFLLPPDVVPK